MNEKVYIVIRVAHHGVWDYYNDCPSNDLDVHVEAIVGVFNTYEVAVEVKKDLEKTMPLNSFYVIERIMGCIHTPHTFRKIIEGVPVVFPELDDDDDE
jgi:hypothetical protein